jgi:hypothetical protein
MFHELENQKRVYYNPVRRPPLGRPGHREEDNINRNFRDNPLRVQTE